MGTMVARLMQPPQPLHTFRADLAGPVEAVVMRALAAQPEDRFATASALVTALRQACEGMDTAAAPGTVVVSVPAPLVAEPPVARTAALGATIAAETLYQDQSVESSPSSSKPAKRPIPGPERRPRNPWLLGLAVGIVVIGMMLSLVGANMFLRVPPLIPCWHR
ncbi:MAG: hypothetical protein HC837_10110, partial [Chloroflexaceae bacterium]|nr:hypothetical protein [Chloroflexaceae bacterium]